MTRQEILYLLRQQTKDLDLLASSFLEMDKIPVSLLHLFEKRLMEIGICTSKLSECLYGDIKARNKEINPEVFSENQKEDLMSNSEPLNSKEVFNEVFSESIDTRSTKMEELYKKTPVVSIKDSISINDRFLFQRELFSSDENLFHSTITQLDEMKTMDEASSFLKNSFDWNVDDESFILFMELVQRKFN